MKLIITDPGDPSVGIFQQSWELDCPFDRDTLTEKEEIEDFRQKALEIYQQFSEFKLRAEYDFELLSRNF